MRDERGAVALGGDGKPGEFAERRVEIGERGGLRGTLAVAALAGAEMKSGTRVVWVQRANFSQSLFRRGENRDRSRGRRWCWP